MHSSNSGQGTGCGVSPQITIDETQVDIITSEIEKEVENEEKEYVMNFLPESSPILIPVDAKIKDEQKAAGYRQIKYEWEKGEYKYISRWHERTPNAPKNQKESWVVERKKKGIGFGKNARPKKEEILVGKDKKGNLVWIDKHIWNQAIAARRNGTATKEQEELLDNGHWKVKK